MILQVLAKLLLYSGVIIVVGQVASQNFALLEPVGDAPMDPRRTSSRDGSTSWFCRYASAAGWLSCLLALLAMFLLQLQALEIPVSASGAKMLLSTGWGGGFWRLMVAVGIGAATTMFGAPTNIRAIAVIAVAVMMGGIGHAAADESWPLTSRALDAIHVIAAGAWIGGLLFISQARRTNWRNFSRMATIAAPLVVLSGVGASLLRLYGDKPRAIVASDYGQLLILKTVLVVLALVIGARHRKEIDKGDVPQAASVGIELLVISGVLIATGVLTGTILPGE